MAIKVNLLLFLRHIYTRTKKKRRVTFTDGFKVQSTPVISKSKGLFETLRDIRTSSYPICGTEENN